MRDCRIPDKQHVLRIAHGMIRKIKASRNDNLVRDDKLRHEVVRLRLILAVEGDRILSYQMPRDFLSGVEFIGSNISGLPPPFDLIHLRAVIDAPQR